MPVSTTSATAIAKPTPEKCIALAQPSESPPLDLSTFHWKTLTINEHRVRQLTGPNYPILPLDTSPDGKWLAVAIQTGNPAGLTEITSWEQARISIGLVDVQNNAPWLMQTNASAFPPDYLPRVNWLRDGRLLWVDEAHRVFVGNGQNRRDLNAPVPISQVEYASGNIAFAQAEDLDLWRVDLASETWEKVTTSRPPKVGALGGYFILARDGSYALAFQDGQMWRIPAEMGAVAEPLPDVKVEIVGRGGPSGPISTQLANSPYWLIGLPAEFHGIESEGFVVDVRSGRIAIPKDLALPDNYRLRAFNASPDGKWLAVNLWDKSAEQEAALYSTPADDLTAGRKITGYSVLAWHTAAPAIILKENTTDAVSVVRLPLADTPPVTTLIGAQPPFGTLPDLNIAVDTRSPARLLQFSLDGSLLGIFDLSTQYESILAMRGTADRLFLGVKGRQTDNACVYALIEWRIEP